MRWGVTALYPAGIAFTFAGFAGAFALGLADFADFAGFEDRFAADLTATLRVGFAFFEGMGMKGIVSSLGRRTPRRCHSSLPFQALAKHFVRAGEIVT